MACVHFVYIALNWERESTRQAEEAVSSLLNNPISSNGLISPDTAIFNALLNCWAKSGSRGATQRAEEILAEMKREYRDNGNSRVKPNSRTYTTVIDVLSKSGEYGSASRSLEILDEMERIYKQGDKDAKPNVYTYTTVINCFARSKEVDKAVKAVDVLQRMEEQYRQGNEAARPNVIAYNSVLNACAYTPDNAPAIETAFKIACLVFDEVRTSDYVQPSHVSIRTHYTYQDLYHAYMCILRIPCLTCLHFLFSFSISCLVCNLRNIYERLRQLNATSRNQRQFGRSNLQAMRKEWIGEQNGLEEFQSSRVPCSIG